jgi:hypothetical protein
MKELPRRYRNFSCASGLLAEVESLYDVKMCHCGANNVNTIGGVGAAMQRGWENDLNAGNGT